MGNFIEEPVVFTSIQIEKYKNKELAYILQLSNSWWGDNY